MGYFRVLAAVLLAAWGISKLVNPAAAAEAAPNAVVGKVEGTYVRQAANFFIEKSLIRNPANAELWSEIRFAAPLADGRKSEIVRLPDSTRVERGDLVSARLADKRDFVRALIPQVSRMVALVAKHDSLAAMMFDLPKAD